MAKGNVHSRGSLTSAGACCRGYGDPAKVPIGRVMMRNVVGIALVVALGLFLISCRSDKPDATLTPIRTTSPTSATALPPTLIKTPTPTPFIPIFRGTLLPPAYDSITAKTAKSVIVLAKWKIESQSDEFIAFSSDNNSIFVGRQIWRVNDGIMTGVLEGNPPSYYQNANPLQKYSPDERFYARTNSAGDIEIDNLRNSTASLYYYMKSDASKAVFFPDGQYMLVALNNGQVWFVAIASWEQRLLGLENGITYGGKDLRPDLVIDTRNGPPQEVFVSSDCSTMAFILQDDTVQIWKVANLTQLSTIKSPKRPTTLAFAPDSALLAISSGDNLIRLWNTQDGQLSAVLEGHQENIDALAFSPSGRLLASLDDKWLYIWGVLPNADSRAASDNATAIAHLNPTITFTPASLPKPTPTPTSSLPSYETLLPLPWAVRMPSDEQIVEAKSCTLEALAKTRYPMSLSYEQLESAYKVQSACDWATLAAAYITHFDKADSIPNEGKAAFIQSVSRNSAFAFKMPLFYSYFGGFELVASPPFVKQPITAMTIDYHWGGIGEPPEITYHIEITQAHLTEEKIKVIIKAQPGEMIDHVINVISPTLIQAIRSELIDFLPVRSPIELETCTDNSPEWRVNLTFLDGTQLTLNTYNSNMFKTGGPWQTQINGQNYLQFSPALLKAFINLFSAFNLQLGQPWAMFCDRVDVFSLAYP